MSWQPCPLPVEDEAPPDPAVEAIVVPRSRDIGGLEVRRVLPSVHRRMVGSFVFLDQMGPALFASGQGLDVRPHPHIGLATMTYLLDGSILHRDSLGTIQPILPGAVNWMSAGRGIVHSERTAPELRPIEKRLYGLQLWVALPADKEESAPAFTHYDAAGIPITSGEGVEARIVVGDAFGHRSPVRSFTDLFFLDLKLDAGARFTLPALHDERALYLIEGKIELDGQTYDPGQLLVLAPGRPVDLKAATPARLVALGGEPLDGPRHIWWNFVSSRKDRIDHAKEDWRRERFGLPVPGETEFIPLPE